LFYHTSTQVASGRGLMECVGRISIRRGKSEGGLKSAPHHIARLRELLDRPCRELALFAEPGLAQHLLDEARVQGVAGADRGDLADDGAADQGEVADEVEHLVADELVAEAQRSVHHAALVEDDAVLDRAAARQAGRAQLVDVLEEAVRARRRDLLEEAVVLVVKVERLPPDAGVLEVDLVLDDEAVGGNDADALLAVDDFDRLRNAQDRDLGVELADAGGVDEVHEREGAAVNDGDLGAVDDDVDV